MFRFTLLAILCSTLVGVYSSNDQLWHHWKRLHGKEYNAAHQEKHRRSIWEDNVAKIKEHNLKHDLGLVSYSLGLNQFADMDWTEFSQTYLPLRFKKLPAAIDTLPILPILRNPAPIKMDWREKGAVTQVKNQGSCGSCWAFSATGAVEGQYNQQFASEEFSEQQLVDCSSDFSNHGCNGGLMENAYNYINAFGLESESDYPYKALGLTCKYDQRKTKATVTGKWIVHNKNEESLKMLIANHGPAAVAIDADIDFQLYKGGVFVATVCNAAWINHGVLAVGYGREGNSDYWIVKNSWGKTWGESGYIRMARNHDDMCGIASMASVPQVEKLNRTTT